MPTQFVLIQRIVQFHEYPFLNLGAHSGGETPVPIPNTAVKPSSAEDTALVTEWENRSVPRLRAHLRLQPHAGAVSHLTPLKDSTLRQRITNPVRDLLLELWQYRELLRTLVIRELRVRYKNSILGFFWSLVNPLATVLVMTLVFKYVMGMRIANYSAYILAAYLPWTFFQFALLDSSQTILVYMQVIKKIYFPRVLLPLAAVLANFVHFLLAMGVLFVYLYGYVGTPLQLSLLWLPVIVLSQLLWVVGLSALIACWNAFYEDVKYLVSVGLQLLFFLTPIIYFSEQVRYTTLLPEAYREGVFWAYHLLNPMATLAMAYRKAVLPPITIIHEPAAMGQTTQFPDMPLPLWLLGANLLAGAVVALGGLSYFRKREWEFVERP